MVDDDRRTDDGRTPDHGHPISSPCEPNGSGELIKLRLFKSSEYINEKGDGPYHGFGYLSLFIDPIHLAT